MNEDEFDTLFTEFVFNHLKSVKEELYNHVLNDFINDETDGKLSDIIPIDQKGKVKKIIDFDDPIVHKFKFFVNDQFNTHIEKIFNFKIQFELYNDILFISECKFFYVRVKNLSRNEILTYCRLINYFNKVTTNDCILSIVKKIKNNGETKICKIETEIKFKLLEKYTDNIIVILNDLYNKKEIDFNVFCYFLRYFAKKVSDIMIAKKINSKYLVRNSNLGKIIL